MICSHRYNHSVNFGNLCQCSGTYIIHEVSSRPIVLPPIIPLSVKGRYNISYADSYLKIFYYYYYLL